MIARGEGGGVAAAGGPPAQGGCGGEGDKVAPAELFGRAVAERDVIAGAIGGLDDGVVLSRQLVGEALGCHATVEGRRGPLREGGVERAVPRRIAVESGVHLLDDVTARSQLAQGRRPVRRQAPGDGRDPLREAELREVLHASCEGDRVLSGSRVRAEDDDAVDGEAADVAVERREAVLKDLAGTCALEIELRAGAEVQGGQLLGAGAHAVGDVLAVETDREAVAVDPADDDVRVRVVRVVVVDGRPVQTAPDVLLHLGHEPPDVGRHVELVAVLGRQDEAELVLLSRHGPLEVVRVCRAVRTVEVALRAVALDALPLDVPEVQRGALQRGALHLDDARLDDGAARERRRRADDDARLGGPHGARRATPPPNAREHRVAKCVSGRADRIFLRAPKLRAKDREIVVFGHRWSGQKA